jgi:hypothetical protein
MKARRWLGSFAVIAPLIAILVAATWFAILGWTAIEGPAIPLAGYIAMALGILFSLIVGVGLMSLVFYSRRHGYDDAADRGHQGEP